MSSIWHRERLAAEGEVIAAAVAKTAVFYGARVDEPVDADAMKAVYLAGIDIVGLVAMRVDTGSQQVVLLCAPGFYFRSENRWILPELVAVVTAQCGRSLLIYRGALQKRRARAADGERFSLLPKRRAGRRGGRKRRARRGFLNAGASPQSQELQSASGT